MHPVLQGSMVKFQLSAFQLVSDNIHLSLIVSVFRFINVLPGVLFNFLPPRFFFGWFVSLALKLMI